MARRMNQNRITIRGHFAAAMVAASFVILAPSLAFADVEAANNVAVSAGFDRMDALIASITIFVLAIFVGFEVITKVPPTLHTPLMSGSNAISGITIVGALIAAGTAGNSLVAIIGMLAVAMAGINVVGGFLVTHRMLSMFRKK